MNAKIIESSICPYYGIPFFSFVFLAVSSILLVIRIDHSKTSSKVVKFGIFAMSCWILQDIVTQLFYCCISCSFLDGFPLNVASSTYGMTNVANYLFMIEKYVALTNGRSVLKPHHCFLFVMKMMVLINGTISLLIFLVPRDVRETGQACVATSFGYKLLYTVYPVIDICITFLGLYLFSLPFRAEKYQVNENRGNPIHVAERNPNGPSHGSDLHEVNHASIEQNHNARNLPTDTRQVLKWNFIGVLVGQIPTLVVMLLSVVFHNTRSFMTYRRLILKPAANQCNVLGINLMFQDHRYIYAKLLQVLKNRKGIKVEPVLQEL